MPKYKPNWQYPVAREIAIGIVIGMIAAAVWILFVEPDTPMWQIVALYVVAGLLGEVASRCWDRWRKARHPEQSAS